MPQLILWGTSFCNVKISYTEKKKFPTRKQTHFILIWLLIMILPESDMFQAQKSSAKIFTFYTCPCPLKVKSSIKIQTVVNSIQWEWQTTGVIKVGFIFLKERTGIKVFLRSFFLKKSCRGSRGEKPLVALRRERNSFVEAYVIFGKRRKPIRHLKVNPIKAKFI